jgi:hypothetical protein
MPLPEPCPSEATHLSAVRPERHLPQQTRYTGSAARWKVEEKAVSQVVECSTCGRAAVAVCSFCNTTAQDLKRYTAEQVEDMILRWCGWPDRTIAIVRHAFMMEACGGMDRGPVKPPEQPT